MQYISIRKCGLTKKLGRLDPFAQFLHPNCLWRRNNSFHTPGICNHGKTSCATLVGLPHWGTLRAPAWAGGLLVGPRSLAVPLSQASQDSPAASPLSQRETFQVPVSGRPCIWLAGGDGAALIAGKNGIASSPPYLHNPYLMSSMLIMICVLLEPLLEYLEHPNSPIP
jgi:hypothetical protein